MNAIVTVDSLFPPPPDPAMHPVRWRWLASPQGWLAQMAAHMQ